MTHPPTNKGATFAPTVLTPVQVSAVLAACSTRSSSGVRLRGLIAAMYGAGLRVQEALDLRPADLDVTGCQVTVRAGKGGRRRVVSIDPQSCALLSTWLERRRALGLTGRYPVFAAYSAGVVGTPLDQRYVRRALAKAAVRAGIEQRVHPHALRHSHAARPAKGGRIDLVSKQLGRARLDTTQTYLS
ncbi:tyrosine-type recombinase/integrase [Luteipulveratus flavus]|uniref:Tyrosine-type recombinase/integrase n=1 Tax=Luteipulveratus flavus TaxID=3031728 RepID=A0ABT6CBB8_9MICO|nr:tyrosine-type recombinase/integrase [Luteipulveratus sp. YIM 133296]MDF8266095.1 tyrosine-type recombinase/integrase [Luteipulveratus sp. YIM 133296]